MIRLGKTFGNLMVDLRATNVKLDDRSERIVMEVCERRSRDEARALLDAAGGTREDGDRHALHSASSREEAERALDAARRRHPPRARPARRRR